MSENKEIPAGWKLVMLEEVVDEFVRGPFGGSLKKECFVPSGYKVYEQRNAIYQSTELGEYFIKETKYQELIRFEVKPADFIVSCSGTIGKLFMIPEKSPRGVINQALLIIRINRDFLLDKFFMYLFTSSVFQRLIINDAKGTAMLNLAGVKDMKLVPVLLPPIPEQRAIVAKIEELFSSLDKGIESLKTVQQQLKVYRQAVLKWAFEGKLTNKNVVEGEMPSRWALVRLGDLVVDPKKDLVDGPFGSNLKADEYMDSGVPVFKIQNIKANRFVDKKINYITEEKAKSLSRHSFVSGDLIITKLGAPLGLCCKVPEKYRYGIIVADLMRLRPNSSVVYDEFLINAINCNVVQNQFKAITKGTTRPRVNLTIVREIQIPLPPLPEQSRIVAEIESRLSVCDKIEESIEHSLKQSEALRQSILKKAFEGKLVPQDPSDEPISVLLERIKAEREKNKLENPSSQQAGKVNYRATCCGRSNAQKLSSPLRGED